MDALDLKEKAPFRLALIFYAPEGADLSMPLACLSAYLKQQIPDIQVYLVAINTKLHSFAHTVPGFVGRIEDVQPDLIAFSCMSPHWHVLDSYLTAVKHALPDIPVLVGGYQAILAPEQTISHPAVDFICVGDGEKPLEALVKRLSVGGQERILGLWEKDSTGEVHKTSPALFADLRSAPFPDYSLFEQNGSLRNLGLSIFGPQNMFVLPAMTGRGCPYTCTYCCNTSLLELYRGKGTYIRKYDPRAIVEELCKLRDKYQVEYFEFWDELFLADVPFAYSFFELYQQQVRLPFSINSRVEMMDKRFCMKAREAGCHTIWFGIESGSESYRQNYLGRKMSNQQIIGAAENARNQGIQILAFNIVGMPFETKQNLLETLELNRILKPEFFFFFTYIPLKGTALYELAETSGLLISASEVQQDYQEAAISGQFRMNIREHPEGMTSAEFSEVCSYMQAFQNENNRLLQEFNPPEALDTLLLDYSCLPEQQAIQALVFELEYGVVEYLHRGYYDDPTGRSDAAQLRSVQLLCSHLPQAGKLLVVGCGLGGLTERLVNQGYVVTGLTPVTGQIEIARRLHGRSVPVRCSRLEDFSEESGTWDALIFHESSPSLSMLDLFEWASTLLKPDGEIIVFDEFALKHTEAGVETHHHKGHFLALAERFGFVCQTELDCTAAVLPSFDFFEGALRRHQTDLLQRCLVSEEDLDALDQSNRRNREKYQEGRLGYCLLRLRRVRIPSRCLRQVCESDQPEVSRLFEQVFGQSLPLAFWRWKYGPDQGDAIGLWQDGKLIVHYGGMVRQFCHAGAMVVASQSCDVMVAPHVRASLSRKGPFFLTCSTYLEQFVGYGRSCLLAYGFPNERAYRLPHKLGLYSKPVTRVNAFLWPAAATGWRMWNVRVLDLNASADCNVIDSLWQTMLRDLDQLYVGVRDAAYWDRRYRQHPFHSYSLVLVYHRIWRTPLGVLALKQDAEQTELLDWVAPVKNIPQLIAAGRQIAFQSGSGQLYLWGSEPVADKLASTMPAIQYLTILVPTNAWTEAPPHSVLEGRLWLTGGDTDFR